MNLKRGTTWLKKQCNYKTFKINIQENEASIELSNSTKPAAWGPANKRGIKEKKKKKTGGGLR